MKKVYLLLITALLGYGMALAQKPAGYHELPKDGWIAVADTFQAGQPGSNAIDGDLSTLWHSPWDGNAYPQPHWLTVDFGKDIDIDGFVYFPRPDGGNGTIKTYGLWVSTDSITWDSIAGGTWQAPWDVARYVLFNKRYTVRYMKLISWEERYGNGFTSCAEIGVLVKGADFVADKTEILRGETVQYTDQSASDEKITGWSWTFEGGKPGTYDGQTPPAVKYDSAGIFDVKLVITLESGAQDSMVMKDYISVNIATVDRSSWSVLYVDSYQSGRDPEYVLDGDPNTFWHTQWSPSTDPYPHTLVIDMGAKVQVEGFVYVPRPGGGNGTVKDYEFYVLEDTSMWTDPGTWGDPVATGTWSAPWDAVKKVYLDKPVLGRYLIFYALSEKNNGAWTSCAELKVMGSIFGSVFTSDRNEIYATQKVNFYGGPDGKASYEWVFEGGDPATSSDQDVEVKYDTAGVYDVTLITTTFDGLKDTLVRSNYVTVKARPTDRPFDKDGWEVISWDSQEEPNGRYASNVIDGDLNTFWHTAWSERQDPYPHWLIIDMKENKEISGFVYYPRPGGGNGTVDSCAWLVSLDGEIWDTVAVGDRSEGWADPWEFKLDKNVTARFVQFLALSEKGYPENPNRVWASCGEIDVLTPITGTYFEAEPLRIESGGTVYYLDLSAGDPTEWNWTFQKGSPETSKEQSPAVTYNLPYEDLGVPLGASLTVNGETFTRDDYVMVDYFDPNNSGGVSVDSIQIGNAFQIYTGYQGKYERHVDQVITLVKGTTYVCKTNFYLPWNNYWVGTGMYIDWNQDYHFDRDPESIEKVYYYHVDGFPVGDSTVYYYLKVPDDAPTGLTRMRVFAGVWGADNPYGWHGYGQTEDYTVKIVDAPTAAPVAAFDADTNAICAGGSIRFEYTYDDETTVATQWHWEFTDADGNVVDTSNVATPTITFEEAGTYTVTLTVTNSVGSDTKTFANWVTVYASTPINAGDDIKVCPGSEVVLDITEVDSVVWTNGVIDGEPFYPTDSMVYVATGYNEHNCVSYDTVSVAVWPAVDTSVVKQGEDTLIAQADPQTHVFQWIYADDGTPVEGATDSIFVAQHGGNYAVVVTRVGEGDCSDTSSVWTISITGIDEQFGDAISIYPNPNSGNFTVEIGKPHATISVYNTIGSLVYRKEDANPVEQLSIDSEGVYFVKIELNGVIETRRVIVR